MDTLSEHDLVNNWLREIGYQTHLDLRLDANGLCAIGHSSGVDCAIEVPAVNGMVYLRAPLAPWTNAPGLAEQLLIDNFLGLQNAGASLAIDELDQSIVLWSSRSLSTLDQSSFATMLATFLESAAQARQRIDATETAEPAARGGNDPALIRNFSRKA